MGTPPPPAFTRPMAVSAHPPSAAPGGALAPLLPPFIRRPDVAHARSATPAVVTGRGTAGATEDVVRRAPGMAPSDADQSERIAARLDELARLIRVRGIAALGDELQADELGRRIAAVVTAFHEEDG